MMMDLWLFGSYLNFLRNLVLFLCTLFFLKIKVSVSSGGDCIRTYKPEIKKGSYNNIVVNVKTAVADNLLFYLGSAKFVSLIFSFSWPVYHVYVLSEVNPCSVQNVQNPITWSQNCVMQPVRFVNLTTSESYLSNS